jgi:hypothetical protein
MFDFPFNTKTKKISVISFLTILTSKIKFQNMEDSLKSQPDKEGKVSKLSLFDIGDEYRTKYSGSTCSCKSN